MDGKYNYTLTNYGLKHLKWLEEDGHLGFVQLFDEYVRKMNDNEIEESMSFKDFKNIELENKI